MGRTVSDSLTVTADDMWGRQCLAYNIQAVIPGGLAGALASIQQELGRIELPAFNPCPRETLHISIFALVPVRSAAAGKKEYWENVSSKAVADLEGLCRGRRAMAVGFDELRVTPTAIIAAAHVVPELIAGIRSHYSAWPAHPGWSRPQYDIIHVTLARFAATARVPDALVREVTARPISLAAHISRLQLVRETIYPSLKAEVLAAFDLEAV